MAQMGVLTDSMVDMQIDISRAVIMDLSDLLKKRLVTMIVDIATIGAGITRAKEAHTSLGQRMRDTILLIIVMGRAGI